MPLFFNDPAFREHIVSNMRYNEQVFDYWRAFTFKSKYKQSEMMEAAHVRAETILGHPYIKDILGQPKTTVDFLEIIENSKIVLVNLSERLQYEARKIIGTLLLSELLFAIQRRQIRSGQYIKQEKPARTEIDMVHEVVRKLVSLDEYAAYVKLVNWVGQILPRRLL